MELKEDVENPRAKCVKYRTFGHFLTVHNSIFTRFGLQCRLKKAVRFAGELVSIANELADDKTKLEAEAYSCWQQGNLFFENEAWGEAKDNFMRARQVQFKDVHG